MFEEQLLIPIPNYYLTEDMSRTCKDIFIKSANEKAGNFYTNDIAFSCTVDNKTPASQITFPVEQSISIWLLKCFKFSVIPPNNELFILVVRIQNEYLGEALLGLLSLILNLYKSRGYHFDMQFEEPCVVN